MDRHIPGMTPRDLAVAAEKPPPYHVPCEIALMAAEESGDYE